MTEVWYDNGTVWTRVADGVTNPGADPPPVVDPNPPPTKSSDLYTFRSIPLAQLANSSNAIERRISQIGHAEWVGDWYPTNQVGDVVTQLKAAAGAKGFPCVLYAIPNRDNGGYSAGGFANRAEYLAWIQAAATAAGTSYVWWIVEPDAVALSANLSSTARAERLETIKQAVDILRATNPNCRVYIDAGAGWRDAAQTADLLHTAGIGQAHGFSVNVSNFVTDEASAVWADAINTRLVALGHAAKKYLVDSSRNGQGPLSSGFPDAGAWYAIQSDGGNRVWCNPPGRGAGAAPQVIPGHPNGETLYIKKVGESDGAFPTTTSGQSTLAVPAPPAGSWYQSWWDDFVAHTNPAHIAAPGTTPTVASAARFPGDTNPKVTGKFWWGACITGSTPARHETPTGHVLPLNRLYWNDLSDLAPNGPLVNKVKAEHTAGRMPWASFKLPNWQTAADGGYDYLLDPLIDALEGLSYPLLLTLNHEPENDHGGPSSDDAQFEQTHGAAYRGMQRRFRARMNARGSIRRIGFVGSLMYYTWNPISGRNPDAWWPGQINGKNVWDAHGADHYTEPNQEITRDVFQWFVAYCEAKNIPITLPEWGLRSEDGQAVRKMGEFYEYLLTKDCIAAAYFDTDVNSTGSGWELTSTLLTEFRRLMQDPRSVTLNEMGY